MHKKGPTFNKSPVAGINLEGPNEEKKNLSIQIQYEAAFSKSI